MKKRSAAALNCLLCAAVRDVLKTEKSSRRCLASAAGDDCQNSADNRT